MHTCEEAQESKIGHFMPPQEFTITGQLCNIKIIHAQIPTHSSTG